MAAAGYIRRSNGKESVISEEAQLAAIGAIAADRGDVIDKVFRDWGESGGDAHQEDQRLIAQSRKEFLDMLDAIHAGSVHAVYLYDTDRSARRVATQAILLDVAASRRCSVIDRLGRDLAGKDRLVADMMAAVDSEVLRKMTVRAKENARRRRLRGDEDGPPPYGYRREWTGERFAFVVDDPGAIALVVDTYRETRSLNVTSTRLNQAGVKADRGGAWHAASVARVIDRNAPELRANAKGRGVRAAAKPRVLSRLLRCHCGQVMSPSVGGRGGVRWYCRNAVVGLHDGPRGISENKLLPFVRAEAARLRTPDERVALSVEDDPAKRAKIEKLTASIASLRGIASAEVIAALEAERDALTTTPATIERNVPSAIDWDWPVAELNDVLRALWDHVRLGPDLLPVEAAWIDPSWRRDD